MSKVNSKRIKLDETYSEVVLAIKNESLIKIEKLPFLTTAIKTEVSESGKLYKFKEVDCYDQAAEALFNNLSFVSKTNFLLVLKKGKKSEESTKIGDWTDNSFNKAL